MADHAGEQEMELEALEAIFPDDLEEFDGSNPEGWSRHGKTWAVTVRPSAEAGEEDEEPELVMQLLFAHTPTYPDEPPSMRLRSVRGLSDADLAEATAELQGHVADSLGMAMIFNLITAAQEWLAARVAAGPASAAGADPEAEEKRRREEEEAARAAARAHGTHVTVEAFLEWKKKFDAEQALAQTQLGGSSKGDAREGRLTGKAWFLQQISAGKVESGSEEAEDDFEGEEGEEGEEEDEDFDPDADEDDSDDEALLDAYLATKAS